jgi:hypothetical protein
MPPGRGGRSHTIGAYRRGTKTWPFLTWRRLLQEARRRRERSIPGRACLTPSDDVRRYRCPSGARAMRVGCLQFVHGGDSSCAM